MTDKPSLADARRVTAAATRGPWTFSDTTDVRGHKGEFRAPSPDNGFMLVDPWCNDDDAEFIAASRTLVPALLAAVDAVLALHRPSPRWVFARDEHVTICETCTNTEVARSRAVMWPCPTVRAIAAHLDIEEQR